MEKFIPYAKLSKKAKRALDARKRGTWGGLNPVTRKPANPRAYDRNKAKRWKADDSLSSSCAFWGPAGTKGPRRYFPRPSVVVQ